MNTIAPNHYKTESGLQVWDVTRYMSGNMAQAFQYVYRAGRKGDEAEDLRKAMAFLEDWVAHPVTMNLSHLHEAKTAMMQMVPDIDTWRNHALHQIWCANRGDHVCAVIAVGILTDRIAELGGVDG